MNLNHGFDQISSCPNCRVRAVELFGDAEEIATIMERRTYASRATLFTEGDAPHGIFLIDSGRLKLIRRGDGERREIIKIARRGDVVGLAATLTNRPHRVTAEAVTETALRFMSASSVLNFLKAHPMVLGHVVTYLEHHAHQELAPLAPTPLVQRVAMYLLAAAEREGCDTDEGTRVDLPVTLRELSWVLHIRPERLEDVLDRFEDRRLLYRAPRSVTLLDEAALASISRG